MTITEQQTINNIAVTHLLHPIGQKCSGVRNDHIGYVDNPKNLRITVRKPTGPQSAHH